MKGETWKKIVIIATIVFVILLVLIGLLLGMRGLLDFFKFVTIGLLSISILFGIGYVIYLLFIKQDFKDIPAVYRKKLYSASKIMKNDMLGDLYLSGDTKHNRLKLGKYFYLRINLPKLTDSEDEFSDEPLTARRTATTEAVPIDCFIIQKEGFMDRMFAEPMMVLVKPEDHNYSAIFNDVTISGFNLVPLDSQFFTIDKRNLDLDMVKGLSLNYIREVVYTIFEDLDKLVKQAMNLDQKFQKNKEMSREFEIPSMPFMGNGGQGR